MLYDVFICYRRDGGDFLAYRIYKDLTDSGYSVFIDDNVSENLRTQIIGSIHRSSDFIFIIPPNCFENNTNRQRDWVIDEVKEVLQYNIGREKKERKQIIPVVMYYKMSSIKFPSEISGITDAVAVDGMCFKEYEQKLSEIIKRLSKHKSETKHKRIVWAILLCAIIALVIGTYLFGLGNNHYFSNSFTQQDTQHISSESNRDFDGSESSSFVDSNEETKSYDEIDTDVLFNGVTATSNIINGGIANYYNGKYYLGDNTLRSSERINNNMNEIYNGTAYYINIIDDTIYFVSPSEDYSICKTDIDGKNFEVIYRYHCHELTYYNGALFFCCNTNDNEYYICKMELDNYNVSKICKSKSWFMNISNDGIIYYVDFDNNSYLCSVNTDGSENKVLLSDDRYYDLYLIDNNIYYSKGDNSRRLYKTDTNTMDTTLIRDSYTTSINYANQKLYFINADKSLCCINLDGNDFKVISDLHKYRFVCIIPGYICCCDAEDTNKVYFLKDDYNV